MVQHSLEERIDRVSADLRGDEGWREQPYNDHLGYLTIGYGFLIDPRRGGRIPRPVGEFWLRWEIEHRMEELGRRWPPFHRQPEDVQAALLNMAFQLGVGGVLRFRRMLAALAEGDRQTAGKEARDSNWYRQTPKRAERNALLIEGPPQDAC